MTNRASISTVFARCASEKRSAFVPFITCGYKTRSDTVPLLHALEAGGADIIELGIPFSDPTADGPTIQRSHQAAVDQGVSFFDVLSTVRSARNGGLQAPIVLMGYLNSFFAYGLEEACQDAHHAGANGFIVVDLPPEEAGELSSLARKQSIDFIPLVAPTTSEDRMKTIAECASGYVYCVCLNGVTGERKELPVGLEEFIGRVKRNIKLPLAVGFGICTRQHVVDVGKLAEGVVMGSRIIKCIDEAGEDEKIRVEKVKKICLHVTGRER